MKKRLELFAGIFFILIIALVIVVAIKSMQENKKFLSEGVRVIATINSLEVSGTRKNKSYTMTVSMFTEGEKKTIKSDAAGKTKITIKIDSIMDNALSKVVTIGKYQSVTISITNTTYSKYKRGDVVEVVYLKEEPKNVKMVEEID